jgi:hemoglobin
VTQSIGENGAVPRPSVFEFAGGEPAFLALAAAHHQRCLQDPELNHPFSQAVDPQHVEHLAAYWAEVFGGPKRYSLSHGGHSGMIGIHAGKGSGPDFGERFVACFVQAIDDAHLPDDPDFRALLRRYMESAVGEVISYTPAGASVPAGLEIPRWSWNGQEQA